MNRIAVAAGLLACAAIAAPGGEASSNSGTNKMAATHSSSSPAHTNRLAREKSPYLLQHQHNPVDWYAWGEEAFAKAKKENKPIFLSIGYSTCHWCHVMERESFENDKVAEYLNQHFVSIKVDREERPDVDKIYMTFVQATTGQGGWPLNVFLTTDRKPFFGGTYFPPDNRYGRTGFLQLLEHLQNLWTTRTNDIADSANDIHAKLSEATAAREPGELAHTNDILRRAAAQMKGTYDPQHGGFGGAPKFPQPSQPRLLLRVAKREGDADAIRMVLKTCDHMAAGGIHDQLAGGFARYSVDAEWLVPHFEKMLYDQAQLVELYLDAWLVSGETRYADTARDILDYVLADMTHPDGGFYSAEDADSEGHEGKFYCWTRAELIDLLTPEEFKVAGRYFGITEHGNFVDHSHPTPLPNQNVLSIVDPKITDSERALLASAKRKMLHARAKRIRPHRDDKVLASWNGLMLGAIARAAVALGDDKYRAAAEKNLAFLQAKLWTPPADKGAHPVGSLSHRWRDGEKDQVQLLEGYAFLLAGVVQLYEATLDEQHLAFAIELAEAMLARFYDSENGGFWQSGPDAQDLILRLKEDYDGAEPSGNSIAVMALLRLGKITERQDFTAAGEKSLRAFASRMQQTPQALPAMLQALDFTMQEPKRVVLAGDAKKPAARALLKAIHAVYQPNKVVLGNSGPVEPFAKTLPTKPGTVAYVCTGTSCLPPTSEPATIKASLK